MSPVYMQPQRRTPYNFIHPQRWTGAKMKFLKSLLLGASLINFFVSALPFSGPFSESDIAEREDTQLLARNVCTPFSYRISRLVADIATELKFILTKPGREQFAKPAAYSKKEAVDFVKKIPLDKIVLSDKTRIIYSLDKNNVPPSQNEKQTSGVSDAFPLPYPSQSLLFC